MATNLCVCVQDTGVFFQLFEAVCAEDHCGFMLRSLDKKKERYNPSLFVCLLV